MSFIEDESKGTPIVELIKDQDLLDCVAYEHGGKHSIYMSNLFDYGSLKGSVFNLCGACIGVGLLSLPAAMHIAGFALGLIFLVIGGTSFYWAVSMLVDVSIQVGTRNLAETIKRAVGNWLAIFFDFSLLFAGFGYSTSYQLIAGDLMVLILQNFGVAESDAKNYRWLIILSVAIFVNYPMSILKDMSSLASASLVLLLSIGYTAIVIFAEFPLYLGQNWNQGSITWFQMNNIDLFDAYAIIVYAFEVTANYYIVFEEMKRPTRTRSLRAVRYMLYIVCGIYLLVVICGYFSTFDDTPMIITNRKPLRDFGSVDYFMVVGRIGVYLLIVISVPICFSPIRRAIFNRIWGTNKRITNPENLIISFLWLGGSTCLAIYFPNIRAWISIIGGLTGVLIVFFVPIVSYLKVVKISKLKFWITVIIGGFLILMGFISAVNTIRINVVKAIHQFQKYKIYHLLYI